MPNLKRTDLTDIHESLGAKMVDFAGFLMPVSYSGIIEEHTAVRERAGLFDVSHMGEFLVTGERAKDFVNELITNDCKGVQPGGLQYAVMCRENGRVVDDLLVFVVDDNKVMLIVNASNIEKDFEHVQTIPLPRGVEVRNASDDYALIAVQGPASREVLKASDFFGAVAKQIDDTPYYRGFGFHHGDDHILVSRTGYTGEIGFELFLPPHLAKTCWKDLTNAGQQHRLLPIGLGARDTLRFEASFCLYGHELDEETSPLEAGLGWVVRLGKNSFCGLQALRDEKASGLKKKLMGFELEGRNIARQGYQVFKNGNDVGVVTSGTFSPTLGKSLFMAYVGTSAREGDDGFEVRIRDRSVSVNVTPLPFYKSRVK